MHMKAQLLSVSLALGAGLGCVGNDSAIDLGGAYPYTAACERSTSISIGAGELDVAGNAHYFVTFAIQSDLQGAQSGNTNDFVVDEVSLTYSGPFSISAAKYPVYYVIDPDSSAQSWVGADLFPGEAATQLKAAVVPGAEGTIKVGVQLGGKLRTGEMFRTSTATFPVRVFNSGTTCGGGIARTGPCGQPGGQDGSPVICCPDNAPAC
jgi:hypothetical protein